MFLDTFSCCILLQHQYTGNLINMNSSTGATFFLVTYSIPVLIKESVQFPDS